MTRSVTALYNSRAEAEGVRARLVAIGVDPACIRMTDESQEREPGVFDKLARLIVAEARSLVRLTAEVEPDELEQAARIVERAEAGESAPREITEQSFIFRETAERLVVEKELAVREEIVMRRTAEQHVEIVHDTIRRTEVEVERLGPDGLRSDEAYPTD
jgi:hypothetical protein